jgi:hypothetical protein
LQRIFSNKRGGPVGFSACRAVGGHPAPFRTARPSPVYIEIFLQVRHVRKSYFTYFLHEKPLLRPASLPAGAPSGRCLLRSGLGKSELSGVAAQDNVFRLAVPLIRNPRMSGEPGTRRERSTLNNETSLHRKTKSVSSRSGGHGAQCSRGNA